MPDLKTTQENPAFESSDDPFEAVFWRDEILQIMYWLRGEGLGEIITARDLVSFLEIDEDSARSHLVQMRADDYVTNPNEAVDHFQLTPFGIEQGKRLFAAEFAGLTAQGHGECSNPDCACHTLGPEACAAHVEGGHAH